MRFSLKAHMWWETKGTVVHVTLNNFYAGAFARMYLVYLCTYMILKQLYVTPCSSQLIFISAIFFLSRDSEFNSYVPTTWPVYLANRQVILDLANHSDVVIFYGTRDFPSWPKKSVWSWNICIYVHKCYESTEKLKTWIEAVIQMWNLWQTLLHKSILHQFMKRLSIL